MPRLGRAGSRCARGCGATETEQARGVAGLQRAELRGVARGCGALRGVAGQKIVENNT